VCWAYLFGVLFLDVDGLRGKLASLKEAVSRYIVGHGGLLDLMVVALVSGGHILIEGPMGVGKTTLARVFAQSIGGRFKRVQMTVDLLPSDIIGTYYYDPVRGQWVFREGPVFANIVLVDELNRATPRTQAALLEVMQERQATVEGVTYKLPEPFLLIATQIPGVGAHEGTFPLPLLTRDRFAYSHQAGMPSREEEVEIIGRVDFIEESTVTPVMALEEVLDVRDVVRKTVYVSDRVKGYIVDLVNAVRGAEELQLGPSPRASIWLMRGSRVLAFMEGLDYVAPDHVKKLAFNVLAHRVQVKPEFEAEGVRPADIVRRALEEVEVPKV